MKATFRERSKEEVLCRLQVCHRAWQKKYLRPKMSPCHDYEEKCWRDQEINHSKLQVRLVSGFESQGPPSSKHTAEYLRYVGLEVEFSHDGQQWKKCCGGEKMPVRTQVDTTARALMEIICNVYQYNCYDGMPIKPSLKWTQQPMCVTDQTYSVHALICVTALSSYRLKCLFHIRDHGDRAEGGQT